MSQNNFIVSPRLGAFSLAVPKRNLIADMVSPIVPVDARQFTYDHRPIAESFTAPQNRISPLGNIPLLGVSSAQRLAEVFDYGFLHYVSNDRIKTASEQRADRRTRFDPVVAAVERMTEAMDLRREIRVAAMVANPANYSATRTLTSGEQWSNPASDPLTQIMQAKRASLVPLDYLILSGEGYDALRTHPRVVATVKASGAGANEIGKVSKQQLAEALELTDIFVGEGLINANNTFDPDLFRVQGTSVLNRIYGPQAALVHIDAAAGAVQGGRISWSLTAEYEPRQIFTRDDATIGARGALAVKSLETLVELATAPVAGFLFQNVHPDAGSVSINELAAIAGSVYTGV
jgi:hypothetical protein